MSEILIRFIDKAHSSDINLKNEPFPLFGRMLPCYQDGKWSYTTSKNAEIAWDCFPDENYDYEAMEKDHVFIGAYDGAACVGLAILRKQWHKYLYLHDLKVNGAYRGRHIGTRLIDAACSYAKEQGFRGVWTIGQDNNLAACLFYVNSGFRLGGLDTEAYRGTRQEGKSDIHFYRDI